jgi:hypothetical protein
MSISQALHLNDTTDVDIEGYRLINEEWSLTFSCDKDNNLFVEIPNNELEEDESVEGLLLIHVVDSRHVSEVEEWLLDKHADLLEAERDYNSYSGSPVKPLQQSIVISGIEYFIFSSYDAD